MKAFCILLTHQSVNYFFALNAYDAITNDIPVYARNFSCTSFHIGGYVFVRGMVIRPPGIFLLHISGSVDYICIPCSV